METPSTFKACPQCDLPVGEHTIDGWKACLDAAGLNYTLPYEEVPGGPLRGMGEQIMVGEITVKAATMDAPTFGTIPVVIFTFYGPGLDPMSKVPTPEYALVGDAAFFHQVKQLINQAINGAIRAAA